MDYEVLSQDDQDEVIVAFMLAQERDHYCHEINRERYGQILLTLSAGKFHDRVSELLAETNERLVEVSAIIVATKSQMPPADRVSMSMERLKSKEQV